MKNIFTIWAQTPDFPVCAVLHRVRTLVLFLGMIAFSFTPSAEAQSYVFSKFEVSGNQSVSYRLHIDALEQPTGQNISVGCVQRTGTYCYITLETRVAQDGVAFDTLVSTDLEF